MSYVPLIEVAFEIRFQPSNGLATKMLLEISKAYSDVVRVENEKGLRIPSEIKVDNSELYYIPSYRVIHNEFTLLISDGSLVVSKNCITNQYQGWEYFKPLISRLIHTLNAVEDITNIRRCSLKYTNMFEHEKLVNDNINLNFQMSIGERNLDFNDDFEIRTDFKDSFCTTILKISSRVGVRNICDVTHEAEYLAGLLFIIDLIATFDVNEGYRSQIEDILEGLHERAEKEYLNFHNKKITGA